MMLWTLCPVLFRLQGCSKEYLSLGNTAVRVCVHILHCNIQIRVSKCPGSGQVTQQLMQLHSLLT